MKHMSPERGVICHVLQRARTVAIVGASSSPERHSHTVARYLRHQGYDVIPVRPDRCEVAGLPTYATLADVAGPINLVVIFRRPNAVVPHIEEAAAKHAEAIWLPPGAWSPEAAAAQQHGLTVMKERCIEKDHRHLAQRSGHPQKWGVRVSRRKPTYEDNRLRPDAGGYVAGGGGGHVAGGGARSVLDEKKMVKGAPSPRSGPRRPRPR
jgi:predicted CoA-binding protein